MSADISSFAGLRVAAFESRRADELARLIERWGGVPFVSPSLREVSLDENPAAIDFANRLIVGQIEVVILMTGVGFRHLLETVARRVDRQRFLGALSDVVTVARGPKPVAAMREVGLAPTYRVPEPNTWREVLALLDTHVPLANQQVCVQEYGKPNPSLVAGLEARGARVLSLQVYRWELPADVAPLEANVRALAAGERDVVLFTSAHQLVNMMHVAEQLGCAAQVLVALHRAVVASIGPTTSDMLREYQLSVDVEPAHARMGHLVQAAAERSPQLLRRKRHVLQALAAAPPERPAPAAPWDDSLFLRACRREPCPRTPIWLMRQAGRYMAEYRRVRARTPFLELCKNPQLCAEIMVTAVRRLGVDAAIIFSDLLPILEPMGLELEFAHGEGPVIHNPLRDRGDVDRLRELESIEALQFVVETVRQTRADLDDHIPLIGFAGAPFTLASYAIEGGASRNYHHTKTLMYRDEGAWRAILERLSRAVTLYLNAQIGAGAQCVQLFDSWAGCLGVDDYRRYVLPCMQQIVAELTPGVPVIHFATGNPALVPLLAESGASVIGVDWRVPLDEAWQAIGYDRAIQGNLDPCVLLAEPAEIRRRAREILRQAAGRPGHIFNLGHGVLQQTPVEHAIALVRAVQESDG